MSLGFNKDKCGKAICQLKLGWQAQTQGPRRKVALRAIFPWQQKLSCKLQCWSAVSLLFFDNTIHDFPWKFQASSRLRHLAWQESVANVSLKAWQHSPPTGWIISWAEVPPKRPYDPVYDSDAALLQLSADFQCCNFGWIGSRLGRNWGRLV